MYRLSKKYWRRKDIEWTVRTGIRDIQAQHALILSLTWPPQKVTWQVTLKILRYTQTYVSQLKHRRTEGNCTSLQWLQHHNATWERTSYDPSDFNDHLFDFISWVDRNSTPSLGGGHSDITAEFLVLYNNLRRIGVKPTTSLPYTSQSIRLAERTNRILLDKVCAMISQESLNITFWGEPLHQAVYIYTLDHQHLR